MSRQKQSVASNFVVVILVISLFLNVFLYSQITSIIDKYDSSGIIEELETKYSELSYQYQELNQKYYNLSSEYSELKQSALTPPYSHISGGNITWVFRNLNGSLIKWTMPLDTYRNYVRSEKPESLLYFNTKEGMKTFHDLRPYIQPSFFRNVIDTLTEGKSDKDFVKEVDNVKNQITVYGRGLGVGPYQFPAETLTEGRGVCSDTTILMASMLVEGNRQANYGFEVYIWYVHLEEHTLSNEQGLIPNHAIVEVKFSESESWCIETTTDQFYTYSQGFRGWQFDVTPINK